MNNKELKEDEMAIVHVLIGVVFVCTAFAAWQWYTGRKPASPSIFDKIKDWWKEMELKEAWAYLVGLVGIVIFFWVLGFYARWIIYLVWYIIPIVMVVGFYQVKIKGKKKDNNKGGTP